MRKAILINIGDELLRGFVTNTNLYSISRYLFERGIILEKNMVLPDRIDALKGELRNCLYKYDYIIITGGLGPTPDDITREAVAEVLGKRICYNDELYQSLRVKFIEYNIPESKILKNYAKQIEGTQLISNPKGIAPGQVIKTKNTTIVLLPGPESEAIEVLSKVFENIEPQDIYHIFIRTHSLKENEIVELLEEELKDPQFGVYPGIRGVDIAIICEDKTQLEKTLESILKKLRHHVYAIGQKNIEEVLGEKLRERKMTLATAESCTGGLLGNLITDVSGSSDYFLGGVVTYSNEAKIKLLNVPEEVFKNYGAVSKECAYFMARGVTDKFESKIGISITGIAGPTGGTPEKPVGLVYIGINFQGKIYVFKQNFGGDRKEIKMKSALKSLYLLNSLLEDIDFSENLIKL
ncbi:MAG: CinA family nicotinamide mononucleotide deamidase-related protein [Candidatus Hydrothermia bacterium]